MKIINLVLICISTITYSQIGIYTANPQGVFNIDGKKNNPATRVPNTTQQEDDFTVLASGDTGIGTTTPTEKLDIVGNARLRQVPNIQKDELFYNLGINDSGVLIKDPSVSSYSTYLGFEPMAASHTKTFPLILENGYITKITGTSIGACYGVMVDFIIHFIGTSYLGATLQARATISNTSYAVVNLSSSESIFDSSLEFLAGAACETTSTTGHTLSYSNGQITDTFTDIPPYLPNAGLFVLYKIDKVKQTN